MERTVEPYHDCWYRPERARVCVRARELRSRSWRSPPTRAMQYHKGIAVDIVGLLKTPSLWSISPRAGLMLLQCMYVRKTKPRSYRELSHIFSSQVGTENKAGDYLHPVLHSQDQARLPAIAIRNIVTALLRVYSSTPPARFHAAVFFSLLLFGWWAGSWQGEESGVRQTLTRAFRLALFDLCATAAVARYRLLKSDARRMQLLRPACLHSSTARLDVVIVELHRRWTGWVA